MNTRTSRSCSIDDCERRVWSREMCHMHYYRWHKHGDPRKVLLKVSKHGAPMAFLHAIEEKGDGCVTWPFSTNNRGYAQININGKKQLVSRLMCERANGAPPSLIHQAAHECGNGHLACVAPWHLTWKTPGENTADQIVHGTRSVGEKHSKKLTSAQVIDIRALAGKVSQARIAAMFGISQTGAGKIIRGVTWASVASAEIPKSEPA